MKMERSVYVFISYRRQEPDSSLANALAQALAQAGNEVFIDTGIRWGANWVSGIREALERADYLLLLLSPEAAASEMVLEEVAIAKELALQQDNIPVILPVRIRFPFTQPLPYLLSAYLRNIQQEQWSGPADTDRLIVRLLETIEEQPGWQTETQDITPPGSARYSAPQPYSDPRDLIVPGGALDIDSSFYIQREADNAAFDTVIRPRAMVTIRGPRQTGKTSLIMRICASMRGKESQLRGVFVDFQTLPTNDLQSLSAVWHAIAIRIADQLQLDEWDAASWRQDGDYDRNFSRFLDQFILVENETPLLLCFDEVDRVFESSIKTEFFASVRGFYNRGAMDPSWKGVHWLLVTSSEPSFFIEDLTQSPFNIGLRLELNAFTSQEVAEFARRHGLSLDRDLLHTIMDYIGGRPYLVHCILYYMSRNPEDCGQLFNPLIGGGGIFRGHLHRYLMQFQREEELAEAMRSVVNGQGCADVRLASRLEAAGLVYRDENQKVVPFCRLYAEFFRSELR